MAVLTIEVSGAGTKGKRGSPRVRKSRKPKGSAEKE
jgi:hypothetical protein